MTKASATQCRRGHPRTPENTYHYGTSPKCKPCIRESRSKYEVARMKRLKAERGGAWYETNPSGHVSKRTREYCTNCEEGRCSNHRELGCINVVDYRPGYDYVCLCGWDRSKIGVTPDDDQSLSAGRRKQKSA